MMFVEVIIVSLLMMFGAVQSQSCVSNPSDLPDVCFNSNLTLDCSELSTSGSIVVVNIQKVIVKSYDSTGVLLGTDVRDVNVKALTTVQYTTTSPATKIEFEFVWYDDANAIAYGKLAQCIVDSDLCSPVLNVQPCETQQIELNYENRELVIWSKDVDLNGLAGSLFHRSEYSSEGWCFEAFEMQLWQLSFEGKCLGPEHLDVLTVKYTNLAGELKTLLELPGALTVHNYYIAQSEAIYKLCITCPAAMGVKVKEFSAFVGHAPKP